MIPSRYRVSHAVAATVILVATVMSNGPSAFWRQFLHGLPSTMTPKMLMLNLAGTAIIFGSILLGIWISTLFRRKVRSDADVKSHAVTWEHRLKGMRFALILAPAIFAVAFGLNWVSGHVLELIVGETPAEQELVRCLLDGQYPPAVRCALFAAVLFSAPLLEEPLFRGVVFRGLASSLPVPAAMAISGFIFALIHVNAATMLPLWWLGCAFAWLYVRTGTILAPIVVHAAFNAVNLVLLIAFPDHAA